MAIQGELLEGMNMQSKAPMLGVLLEWNAVVTCLSVTCLLPLTVDKGNRQEMYTLEQKTVQCCFG